MAGGYFATYNGTALYGLPLIAPHLDVRISQAAVETVVGSPQSDRLVYKFPELSGVGTLGFGLRPERRTWLLTFAAPAAASRLSFEADLRRHLTAQRRVQLSSERGDLWPFCVLLRWQHLPGSPYLIPGGSWYSELAVEFEDLQPAEG
jgi:hypothetical protein